MSSHLDLLKAFLPAFVSFVFGIGIAPFVTTFLYKNRMWKRKERDENTDEMSEDYKKLHNKEAEKNTPRIGGVLIWLSVCLTALFFWLLAHFAPSDVTIKLEFLSRTQTWLLFAGLIVGSLVGLVDDLLQIFQQSLKLTHGFSRKTFLTIVVSIALVFAWWFFVKLGMNSVYVPFIGDVILGAWFIPFFVLAMLGTFTSGVIDGIDGLSGGVLGIIFGAFGLIAVTQGQMDIAAFCFVVAGGIMAFLWFNIVPARFYMGETGMLGLTISLTLVAFLTNRALWLLIIGFPLVATSASSFIQIYSKKLFNKKVFKVAPLHHHFQAIGWSSEKVVMRYWVFTLMVAVFGVVLSLIA